MHKSWRKFPCEQSPFWNVFQVVRVACLGTYLTLTVNAMIGEYKRGCL